MIGYERSLENFMGEVGVKLNWMEENKTRNLNQLGQVMKESERDTRYGVESLIGDVS